MALERPFCVGWREFHQIQRNYQYYLYVGLCVARWILMWSAIYIASHYFAVDLLLWLDGILKPMTAHLYLD